ncbi:uncharacterized protein LOC135109459 [Scylla paramamosain]|uniref:uncharacterized protein LOC135109459 n=1 Tax=Scylla paramamosain TaxID=85552 RepID=UPI003083A521
MKVLVYRRCLFCKSGEKGIQHIGRVNVSPGFHLDTLFIDSRNEMQNFKGHTINVVAAPYFPYIAYVRDSNEPGTTVTPTYSVDAYLMSAFATHLNFTCSNNIIYFILFTDYKRPLVLCLERKPP